jgi:hypothetical protein
MNFKVNTGDPLNIPAAIWNKLVYLIDVYDSGGLFNPADIFTDNAVLVVVDADCDAFSCVKLLEPLQTDLSTADKINEFLFGDGFKVTKEATDAPVAVLLEPAAADEAVTAVVSGIAPVRIKNYDDSKTSAKIDADGYADASASGPLRIIWAEAADQTGKDYRYALVSVNAGAGGGSSEYNGQFKVIKYTEGETTLYKVINGAAPDSPYCGYVGLPGIPQITIPVVVKTGMTTPVCYLRTKKDGESYVSAVYENDGTSPAENEDWVQLGVWNSTLDDVEQVWTSNNHFINYRWM